MVRVEDPKNLWSLPKDTEVVIPDQVLTSIQETISKQTTDGGTATIDPFDPIERPYPVNKATSSSGEAAEKNATLYKLGRVFRAVFIRHGFSVDNYYTVNLIDEWKGYPGLSYAVSWGRDTETGKLYSKNESQMAVDPSLVEFKQCSAAVMAGAREPRAAAWWNYYGGQNKSDSGAATTGANSDGGAASFLNKIDSDGTTGKKIKSRMLFSSQKRILETAAVVTGTWLKSEIASNGPLNEIKGSTTETKNAAEHIRAETGTNVEAEASERLREVMTSLNPVPVSSLQEQWFGSGNCRDYTSARQDFNGYRKCFNENGKWVGWSEERGKTDGSENKKMAVDMKKWESCQEMQLLGMNGKYVTHPDEEHKNSESTIADLRNMVGSKGNDGKKFDPLGLLRKPTLDFTPAYFGGPCTWTAQTYSGYKNQMERFISVDLPSQLEIIYEEIGKDAGPNDGSDSTANKDDKDDTELSSKDEHPLVFIFGHSIWMNKIGKQFVLNSDLLNAEKTHGRQTLSIADPEKKIADAEKKTSFLETEKTQRSFLQTTQSDCCTTRQKQNGAKDCCVGEGSSVVYKEGSDCTVAHSLGGEIRNINYFLVVDEEGQKDKERNHFDDRGNPANCAVIGMEMRTLTPVTTKVIKNKETGAMDMVDDHDYEFCTIHSAIWGGNLTEDDLKSRKFNTLIDGYSLYQYGGDQTLIENYYEQNWLQLSQGPPATTDAAKSAVDSQGEAFLERRKDEAFSKNTLQHVKKSYLRKSQTETSLIRVSPKPSSLAPTRAALRSSVVQLNQPKGDAREDRKAKFLQEQQAVRQKRQMLQEKLFGRVGSQYGPGGEEWSKIQAAVSSYSSNEDNKLTNFQTDSENAHHFPGQQDAPTQRQKQGSIGVAEEMSQRTEMSIKSRYAPHDITGLAPHRAVFMVSSPRCKSNPYIDTTTWYDVGVTSWYCYICRKIPQPFLLYKPSESAVLSRGEKFAKNDKNGDKYPTVFSNLKQQIQGFAKAEEKSG